MAKLTDIEKKFSGKITISSKEPFCTYSAVKKRFPNAKKAVVAAFGIVENWYEDDTFKVLVAQELYTKNEDTGSFCGVKTTFHFTK